MEKVKRGKWTLWLFALGVFMAALDNGIITAALTTLTDSFDVSPTWGAWSITIYTLGLAVSVPVTGKMADRFGRKKLFLIEVFLFGLGSLLVALSTDLTFFLIARLIQALGGGGIFIIASAYILDVFPREVHGRALGMLGGMNGIAAVLGPNIGAFLLGITGSWHWLFLINLPVAVFLFLAGWRMLEPDRAVKPVRTDWAGIFLLSGSVLALMISLTRLDGVNVIDSMQNPQVWGAAAAAVILMIVLIIVERNVRSKGEDPFLPLALFSLPRYRWSLVLSFISGGILAAIIFVPAYVEQFLGVDATTAGYWFTPLALASGIGAAGGGALVDRKGPVFTLFVAAGLCSAGFALFPLWVENGWQLVTASCIAGLGFGMMLGAPINVLATEDSGGQKASALATLSLFRQIGLTICPALLAGFLARPLSAWVEGTLQPSIQYLIRTGVIGQEQATAYGNPVSGAGISSATNLNDLKPVLEMVPDGEIKLEIVQRLHAAVVQGFDGLFWTASAMSALTFIALVILITAKNR